MINQTFTRLVTDHARNAEMLPVDWLCGGSRGLREFRMRSRRNAVQLKQFEIAAKRRQAGFIKTTIEEFVRMIANLDLEIEAEHRRTGIADPKHYAYSTFARAAIQRRQNLQASVDNLQHRLTTAEAALDLAEAELARDVEERFDSNDMFADLRVGRRSNN